MNKRQFKLGFLELLALKQVVVTDKWTDINNISPYDKK